MTDSQASHPQTGSYLPGAVEKTVAYEVKTSSVATIVFLCPACGYRWTADEPGAPKKAEV